MHLDSVPSYFRSNDSSLWAHDWDIVVRMLHFHPHNIIRLVQADTWIEHVAHPAYLSESVSSLAGQVKRKMTTLARFVWKKSFVPCWGETQMQGVSLVRMYLAAHLRFNKLGFRHSQAWKSLSVTLKKVLHINLTSSKTNRCRCPSEFV